MKCFDFSESVEQFLDDLLPPARAQGMNEHLGRCSDCAKEYEATRQFRRLLLGTGRDALEAWSARNVTQQVTLRAARELREHRQTSRAQDPATAAKRPPHPFVSVRAWFPWAAAAAVLVVAVGGFVAATGIFSPSRVRALADGESVVLAGGERASPAQGRELQADGEVRLEVVAGSDGTTVRLEQGRLTCRVQPDHPFRVETPRGTASALGTSYHVTVDRDGSVAVNVTSGTVEFDDGEQSHLLSPGRQLIAIAGQPVRLVSVEDLDQLSFKYEALGNDLVAERGLRQRLEEELANLRNKEATRASPAPTAHRVPKATLDQLPWSELGVAAHQLLVLPKRGEKPHRLDADRLTAIAVFWAHAKAIQEATGVSNPVDGLWHPSFISRLAEPLFASLAPDADPQDRAAATAATRSAADLTLARLDNALVPAEVIATRLEMMRAILLATRRHLGDDCGATIAAGIRVTQELSTIHRLRMRAYTAEDVAHWYGKHFDLTDDQRTAVEALAEKYVEATVAVQALLEERHGSEIQAVLFPSRSRRGRMVSGGRSRSSGRVDLPAADRIALSLRDIDVKLEIARPRGDFERAVRELLRDDQRARGFGFSWGLLTFRR